MTQRENRRMGRVYMGEKSVMGSCRCVVLGFYGIFYQDFLCVNPLLMCSEV